MQTAKGRVFPAEERLWGRRMAGYSRTSKFVVAGGDWAREKVERKEIKDGH